MFEEIVTEEEIFFTKNIDKLLFYWYNLRSLKIFT